MIERSNALNARSYRRSREYKTGTGYWSGYDGLLEYAYAMGPRVLTGMDAWLKAWLRREVPRSNLYDAYLGWLERRVAMTRVERKIERAREDQFKAEFQQARAMTPEQHAEMRARDIARLDRPEYYQMPRWDPNKSTAENTFAQKIAQGQYWRH